MISVAEVILAFAWVFGANGFLIEQQLNDIDVLPIAWLEPVAANTRIVFHAHEDWAIAFYLPAVTGDGGASAEAGNSRLALFAPYYLAPDGLVAPSQMPVDVAEYYFHALIEAALDGAHRDSAYAGWLEGRSAELLVDVPQAHQLSAYLSALADFGAHLLAVRNEVARAAERQAVSGRDVCRQLDRSASLFGLWQRSITDGTYAGGYFLPEGRWVRSRQALERSDKDRFLAEFLDVSWSGDPARDFEMICLD